MEKKKITALDIRKMKKEKKKITALTAYDYSFAKILDKTEIDIILVGDSVGMVVLGYENTLPVTMEDMIHHTCAVKRGVSRALIVGDMPFMSYQVSIEESLKNAGRLVQEGGAEAVKIEGGIAMRDRIRAIVDIGIPVMGHVGLTPQSVHRFGGYRVQGKDYLNARKILSDAKAVEDAGAFSIVLEGIPAELGKRISEALVIPTIGIGAGPHCDGQILVIHDLLGIPGDFNPKFIKRYADIGESITDAVRNYIEEVREVKFPSEEHSYHAEKKEASTIGVKV
ncbi:MAG: 3-methyl-2-oxobutanoate hydroxymethyltransferase [Nitrospinota bacterium]